MNILIFGCFQVHDDETLENWCFQKKYEFDQNHTIFQLQKFKIVQIIAKPYQFCYVRLEESNLFLIQNSQETEQSIEELKSKLDDGERVNIFLINKFDDFKTIWKRILFYVFVLAICESSGEAASGHQWHRNPNQQPASAHWRFENTNRIL